MAACTSDGGRLGCLHLGLRFRRLWLWLGFVSRRRPSDDFETSIMMFSDGGAALDPIATIDVTNSEVIVDCGLVNVTANHTINMFALGLGHQRLLKFTDVA